MSGKGKSILTQSSKSTSSKKSRNKRDIISTPPYSEFPATTSTFSGLENYIIHAIEEHKGNRIFCGVAKFLCGARKKSVITAVEAERCGKISYHIAKLPKCMNYVILISIFSIFLGTSNTYASSISISLTGNVNLNILKDNTNPTFGKSTTQTATVTSDHFTGYTLTIAGSNDTGRLVGSNDSTKYLSSITTPLTESQFNTDAHNDQWGFLPSKLNSITNNVYQPSPTTTATTIDVTNSPNTSGENYTLALAARVSPNMALDSYGQTFVLAATGNGYDYHIGFSDNMETLPEDMYGNSQSDTVTLPNTRPTKSGFVFQGWCSEETVVNRTIGTTCPDGADTYQPGDTITLDGTIGNDMELFAIWAKGYDNFEDAFAAAGKTKSGDQYLMQDMTSEICDSIVVGSPTTNENITKNLLKDRRNTSVYLIAKYADGHCWMRQNLDLPLTAGTAVDAYDFATDTVFSYTPANSTQSGTGTAWAQNASDGARSYSGDHNKYIGGMDISTSGVISNSGTFYEWIGPLYNWAAATAQTGAQAAAAGASGETEVKTSICPKGWRLPAKSGDYSFSTLMGSYSLPTTNQSQGYSGQLQNPLNFNRPGYYSWANGALGDRGTYGGFWSAVGYSSMDAHYLGFNFSYFSPQRGNSKGYGFSVRCLSV